MAKLPTALLPRSLPSSTSSTLLASTPHRPTTATTARTSASPLRPQHPHLQQVRHATEVVRPKRPFTWTQVVQLSDGSTYTTRSTSPLPVYRSTKDTRNHLTWQPTERSLQNVEVDEAGKLASFRGRFGTAYELAGPTPAERQQAAEAAAAAATDAPGARGGRPGKGGRKAAAAAAAAKAKEEEMKKAEKPAAEEVEDGFASLLAGYVVDQPQLKGGHVYGKDTSKKGKKK